MDWNKTFDVLAAYAVGRRRCPQRGEIDSAAVVGLAKAGRVRVEIFPRNWRVVEILDGPHKGKRTQEPPGGKTGAARAQRMRPYLVIDSSGTRRNGHLVG